MISRYITHFLRDEKVKEAREIAERALSSIHFREGKELFNIWTAYLNMEVMFGDADSLKAVFDRACGAQDSLKVHKQMVKILARHERKEVSIFNLKVFIQCFSMLRNWTRCLRKCSRNSVTMTWMFGLAMLPTCTTRIDWPRHALSCKRHWFRWPESIVSLFYFQKSINNVDV